MTAAKRQEPSPENMTPEALFDMVAEYRNAPSNTASALTGEQWAQAWAAEWQRANRAEIELEALSERVARLTNDQQPTPGLVLRMALQPLRVKASLVPSTQAALAAVDELEDALYDTARKFTLIEEELASLRRDALRWAERTYDESMAQRIRERLDV